MKTCQIWCFLATDTTLWHIDYIQSLLFSQLFWYPHVGVVLIFMVLLLLIVFRVQFFTNQHDISYWKRVWYFMCQWIPTWQGHILLYSIICIFSNYCGCICVSILIGVPVWCPCLVFDECFISFCVNIFMCKWRFFVTTHKALFIVYHMFHVLFLTV